MGIFGVLDAMGVLAISGKTCFDWFNEYSVYDGVNGLLMGFDVGDYLMSILSIDNSSLHFLYYLSCIFLLCGSDPLIILPGILNCSFPFLYIWEFP